jgi:hypothetical protein
MDLRREKFNIALLAKRPNEKVTMANTRLNNDPITSQNTTNTQAACKRNEISKLERRKRQTKSREKKNPH